MRASTRVLAIAIACLSSLAAAQSSSDQVVAERVLGPRWKQLSRRAGMIFAGTVLSTGTETVTTRAVTTQTAATDPSVPRTVPGAAPAIQLSFRVDEAIAGVARGQILTIHEWAGAWSMHRPMNKGQHILFFLYPPSRLGLTSPVGGSLGLVVLDQTGKNVSKDPQRSGVQRQDAKKPVDNVSVIQLARAIRSTRSQEVKK